MWWRIPVYIVVAMAWLVATADPIERLVLGALGRERSILPAYFCFGGMVVVVALTRFVIFKLTRPASPSEAHGQSPEGR